MFLLVNLPGYRNVCLSASVRLINIAVTFLPAAGNRNNSSGASNNQGSNGNYWSSSVPSGSVNASNVNFNSATLNTNTNNRANGRSVRCTQAFTGRLLFIKSKINVWI